MSSFLDPTLGVLAILCCARIVEGAAMACTVPTSLTLLARLSSTTRARRSRVMGAFEVSSLVGMFVGVGLAGPAWDAWRAGSFVAVAVGYFAAALLLSCGWRGPSACTRGVNPRSESPAAWSPEPGLPGSA
jgi:MFS family permease